VRPALEALAGDVAHLRRRLEPGSYDHYLAGCVAGRVRDLLARTLPTAAELYRLVPGGSVDAALECVDGWAERDARLLEEAL
jgi:hypothetical protein